ncbi:hypothetical protein QJS66_11755 [Kocuria rhizophila]|nr:hypothetical protein QJS66_11755 [Kocuria rhizophila]
MPLAVLGSSLFGAQLAAAYGLPYAFTSHFAPEHAGGCRRRPTAPGPALRAGFAEPYVIAAVNVIVSGARRTPRVSSRATRRAA